jgi:hypothetical protein
MHAIEENRRTTGMVATIVAGPLWAGHLVLQVAQNDDLILERLQRQKRA